MLFQKDTILLPAVPQRPTHILGLYTGLEVQVQLPSKGIPDLDSTLE